MNIDISDHNPRCFVNKLLLYLIVSSFIHLKDKSLKKQRDLNGNIKMSGLFDMKTKGIHHM